VRTAQACARCTLVAVCDADTKVVTLSTESIASSAPAQLGNATPCPNCGSPLAPDQRYCLECGERRVPMSSLLFGTPPAAGATQASPPPGTPPPAPAAPSGGPPQRNQTLTVIAGVGVLLLAMGVGVLIGRAGNSKQSSQPPQVISVAQAATGTTSTTSEASFTSSWPSGTSGYTVQLQTLAQSGTSVSAVEAAKTAAAGKGAKAVGALKSEEFASLTAGSYVIYSGVYRKRAEAEKALSLLRKSFPGAKVIQVSNSASSGSGKETEPPTSSPGGVGTSESKPAPSSVLNNLKGAHGKSYEEKSKNLPDVVETG